MSPTIWRMMNNIIVLSTHHAILSEFIILMFHSNASIHHIVYPTKSPGLTPVVRSSFGTEARIMHQKLRKQMICITWTKAAFWHQVPSRQYLRIGRIKTQVTSWKSCLIQYLSHNYPLFSKQKVIPIISSLLLFDFQCCTWPVPLLTYIISLPNNKGL